MLKTMTKDLHGLHHHETLKFPDGFLWGSGNSAFQVEGGITTSDWYQWEQTHQPAENQAGQSADHFNRYAEDFKLFKDLGQNAHRLSVEWSRIEPEEGVFDQAAIDHYVDVLKSLKANNMAVCLTLHHFSNPAWFANKGGWESFFATKRFAKFVAKITPFFAPYVDLWIPINEPSVYVFLAYWERAFPPQKKNVLSWIKVYFQLISAHKKAYRTIHKLAPKAKVGAAHSVLSFNTVHHHSFRESFMQNFFDLITNHTFMFLTGKKHHDFIGLNYYMNWYINLEEGAKWPKVLDVNKTGKNVSDMGWEIYPQGIFEVISDFSGYKLPIYITENGIASTNDDRRVRFLLAYLQEVYHAIKLGADVRGYFYWCSMDNMELHRGFEPKFGLVEVDFKTQKRTPRPSAYVYREIAKSNGIPHDLLTLLGHGLKVQDIIKTD